MAAEFRGRIAQDIRDSVPDREPYREPQAPDGAPDVLYIVWDDVGFGTFDFFGGLVRARILSAAFRADDRKDNGLTVGTLTLRVDDREVGAIRIRTQPGMFACDGEGLCVGRDSGQAVSAGYDPPFHFLGGTIRHVLVDVSGPPFAGLEKEATGAFMRD